MADYIIKGGKKLEGEIVIDSAKNAILPILAGSILCKGVVKIKRCPKYTDVVKMCDILKFLGSKITHKSSTLVVDNSNLSFKFLPNALTKDIRASIFTLGPLLTRFKKAKLSYPGGCSIGVRGVSTHLTNLEKLGVRFIERHGYIYGEYEKSITQKIYLDIPSVGATENIMMFMASNKGRYEIHNPAKEPEIVDLANFLNKMGAKITGAGEDVIYIDGVESFSPVTYTPIPDRIEAGTMLIAGVITKGDITLKNVESSHIASLIDILTQSGADITVNAKDRKLTLKSGGELSAFGKIETLPYPFFPTDLQSPMGTLASVTKGVTIIKENIFECRFRYVPELIKMGAKIKVNNNVAVFQGQSKLYGAEVYATDLRGGVALVLAGLTAEGYTTLHDVEHIERGYYKLERLLARLGADIKRVK